MSCLFCMTKAKVRYLAKKLKKYCGADKKAFFISEGGILGFKRHTRYGKPTILFH